MASSKGCRKPAWSSSTRRVRFLQLSELSFVRRMASSWMDVAARPRLCAGTFCESKKEGRGKGDLVQTGLGPANNHELPGSCSCSRLKQQRMTLIPVGTWKA